MYAPKNKNISEWHRISAQDYFQSFLDQLSVVENHKVALGTPTQIMRVVDLFETQTPQSFNLLRIMHGGFDGWYEQKMKFMGSNLGYGKGCIAYFVCNGCSRWAKFLYYQSDSYTEQPLCRVCNKLKYQQPKRKVRNLSRLLNKPYLSSEHKYELIKITGITAEDVIATGLNKPL
jgi:hypothetical protein